MKRPPVPGAATPRAATPRPVTLRAVTLRAAALGAAGLVAVAMLPAVPASAAFPGANGRIAYQRFGVVNDLGEIHSIRPDGSDDRNLTGTPLTEDRDPAWSADGRWIAFRRANAGPDQLWIMKSGGTALTVVPGSGVAGAPSWSPDGTRLVYECYAPFTTVRDICMRDVDGSDFRLLTATPALDERRPVWSPDGTRILFSRELAGGGSFLAVLTLRTMSLDPMTPPVPGQYEDWPDWSPDGRAIVFVRAAPGAYGAIYVMKASGGSAGLLVAAPPPATDSHHTMPAWSPDGQKIVYVHLDDDESWGHLYTIGADGTGATQITFGPATDEVPSWRPVG